MLYKNYSRAVEIHKELIRLRALNDQKHLEYDEIVLGASAIVWTLGLLLFKKGNEYQQRLDVPLKKTELIEMGYQLLDKLISLWRVRNKESELRNVVDIFRNALEKVQGI